MEDIKKVFSLEGKVSLVTGGARGLGYEMALALACAGSDLMLVSRTESELLEASHSISDKTRKRVLAITGDLGRLEEIERVVSQTLENYGRIDVLVNNAGATVRKSFFEISPEEFDQIVAINLRAVYFLCQRVASEMRNGGGGKIINIASLTSHLGIKNVSVYGATKGAIYALTKSLAVELAPYQIQVNTIVPGYIKTQLTENVFQDPQRFQWMISRIPMGRTGAPEDLCGAVIFLASAASNYITGSSLVVDGGWTSA